MASGGSWSAQASVARLLEEQKGLLERLKELEMERHRPFAEPRGLSAPHMEPSGPPVDLEEDDRLLDVEEMSSEEAKAFIERLAARRDAVRLMRRSLCGALKQLGERLYTSQVGTTCLNILSHVIRCKK